MRAMRTSEHIDQIATALAAAQGQIEDARRYEGKFTGVHHIDAELGELIASGRGAREREDQRILVFNLGIALEDLATAVEILRRAERQGVGTKLPL